MRRWRTWETRCSWWDPARKVLLGPCLPMSQERPAQLSVIVAGTRLALT